MTTHMKPTILPDEHSCLKAMNSQNWSSVLTLFHCPLLLDGVPPSATILSVPRSGSSSSNSSRNLALGSSGKCGIRHRGGAAGYGAICRSGCVVAQRRGVLGTEGGGAGSLRNAEHGVQFVFGVRLAEGGCEAFVQSWVEAFDWPYNGDSRDFIVFQCRNARCLLRSPPVIAEKLNEANSTNIPDYHPPNQAAGRNDGTQHGDIFSCRKVGRAKHAQKCRRVRVRVGC